MLNAAQGAFINDEVCMKSAKKIPRLERIKGKILAKRLFWREPEIGAPSVSIPLEASFSVSDKFPLTHKIPFCFLDLYKTTSYQFNFIAEEATLRQTVDLQ